MFDLIDGASGANDILYLTQECSATQDPSDPEHGWVTFNGYTFDAGSNGSASMTLRGTLAELNAALSTLTYTAFANYHGADSVQISVNDQGNFGAPGALEDSATVTVTVTDVIDYTPLYGD